MIISSDTPERWRLFWAKTDRSGKRPDWTRPLWAHLYDVANTALLLWEQVLPRSMKACLSGEIGLAEEAAGRWLSMQIGLHDIGKAIPPFQSLHAPSRERLEAAGFPFKAAGYGPGESVHHGHASIPILIDWLSGGGAARGWSRETIEGIAAMIGYHHGKLVCRHNWLEQGGLFGGRGMLRSSDMLGSDVWKTERINLLDAVAAAWGAQLPPRIAGRGRAWPSWLMSFAGWCTLADWLGSMEKAFPEVDHGDTLAGYIPRSRAGAGIALAEAGFASRPALRMMPFGDLFRTPEGKPREPRPLQKVMIERLAAGAPGKPTLTIIEAPAGEGKSEAALYLALRQQAGDGSGIYIAMPSQATSNALFARFESFIQLAHDPQAGAANLVLVHGTSALHPAQERLHQLFLDATRALKTIYDAEEEGKGGNEDAGRPPAADEARVETASWFMPKKRSLLAPYGVGTVDQALLGVLYAKHFFLRHIGLAGKTVIFDEVHAYDTYMNALFHRLLEWLRESGANVILLSATLPDDTRRRMTAAWTGHPLAAGDAQAGYRPYPAVWQVRAPGEPAQGDEDAAEVGPHSFDAVLSQSAELSFSSPETADVAGAVVAAARQGAAVAVIVNTVGRAQAIYREVIRILEAYAELPITSYLFHARFPYEIRSRIEEDVLRQFGPGRVPGQPAILVATQVAEQSLDIDADVMFSDLCPIDLLLQRAGRLHRHEDRHLNKRPALYSTPVLHILIERPAAGELPDIREISANGKIYDKAMLYRTWQLLHARIAWSLPGDYRTLIEGVYGDDAALVPAGLNPRSADLWNAAEKELRDRHVQERREAAERMVPPPGELRTIAERTAPKLAEQDDAPAETHPAYLALTRLGGPSFDVVCLHESDDGTLWLDPGCTAEPLPAAARLTVGQTRRLMECSLRLSGNHMPAVAALMADERWSSLADENPALARYHAMVFRNGYWRRPATTFVFQYDTTYGIIRHTTREV